MRKELKENLKKFSKWYITYTILSRDPGPHKSPVIQGAFRAAKWAPPTGMFFLVLSGLLTLGLTSLILSLSIYLVSQASDLTETLLVAGLTLTALPACALLGHLVFVQKKENDFFRVEESFSNVVSLPEIFIKTWARELREEQRQMTSPSPLESSRYRPSRSERPTWSANV